MSMRFLGVLAAVALIAPAVRADDQDVIQYRQLIMKQLDAEVAALGMIVAGQVPKDTVAFEAHAAANSAKAAQKAFAAKVPGGNSKPEIWAKWDDFSKRLDNFVKKSDELAKISEGGDLGAIGEAMVAAFPCKECHDVYRVPKK